MHDYPAKEMFKWMKDIADSQDRFGGMFSIRLPSTAVAAVPERLGRRYRNCAHNYYRYYGDTDVLREYYPNMVKYIEYMVSRCEDNLVVREEEGGWCLATGALPTI